MLKRCLSVLLAVLLLCSFVSTGFSEAPPEEPNGEVILLDPEKLPKPEQDGPMPVIKPYAPEGAEKAIIGTDDRITISDPRSYPYRAIANMYVKASCGHEWQGTGFMVSKNFLMTAAHCVLCTDCNQWADKIIFYFGFVNEKTYSYKYDGQFQAWAGTEFKDGYVADYDYAYIKLYEDVGNHLGWFGMHFFTDEEYAGKPLWVAGYYDKKLKIDWGNSQALDSNLIVHNADAVGGNSGGPIFLEESDGCYAVAIHIAGNYFDREVSDAGSENYGRRIARWIYEYMLDAGYDNR